MNEDHALPPAIILVEPQMGENIGATARAMANFGLTDLRIVNPRDGWPNSKAVSMSSGALKDQHVKARIFSTVAESLADLTRIYATTARRRGFYLPAYSPAEAADDMLAHAKQEAGRSGILFGGERAGLDNDAIARSHAIIHIPTNPDFSSLNLGQAVLLSAYEWFHRSQRETVLNVRGDAPEKAGSAPAKSEELEFFFTRLEGELEKNGFLFPPEKAPGMMVNIRAMFMRMKPSGQDLQTLQGILSAFVKKRS